MTCFTTLSCESDKKTGSLALICELMDMNLYEMIRGMYSSCTTEEITLLKTSFLSSNNVPYMIPPSKFWITFKKLFNVFAYHEVFFTSILCKN